jgi:hypothetical protein
VDAVPSGSYLALSHLADEAPSREDKEKTLAVHSRATAQAHFRTRGDVHELLHRA